MKRLIKLFCFICLTSTATAQKIEYGFGENSDVIDSVKYVLECYKKNYNQSDITKLNLYAGIDYCDGVINLSLSQYADSDIEMKKLVQKTNRFIRVCNNFLLPIILDTDILSKELAGTRVNIPMGGYFIKIERNEKRYWKVVHMQITF